MAGYIGTGAVPQATQKRDLFTATAGQISFATSGYSPGYVDVYMNGVKLSPTDFTATNGSDVDLAVAAVVDDILEIVSFTSFEVTLGGLQAANNLSDLVDAPTAITNLGVTSTAAELNKLTGATLSTAELNQLNAITRGSILYGDASGATARLAAGGANTVLTSDGTDISWAAAATGGGAVPAGTVIYHAANTAPTDFIKANGAAVSRTTYSDLFAAIGTTFGVGDGSSTFNVPDLRGEFMRGWDDSRGIDSGRSFGSAQSDEFKSHLHGIGSGTGTTGGGNAADTVNSSTSLTTQSTGGSETRPRNIALLACIKY